MAWVHAWAHHQPPPQDKIGLMYLLAGGADASSTDPYAQQPTADNNWISPGPVVMIVGPAALRMMAGYPREARPDTSRPYVMWQGTPYEHLTIPVR
jgi:hypothetical protein